MFDLSTPDMIRVHGAYFKGGENIQALQISLKTEVPEDLRQFHETYGESLILTRGMKVRILSLNEMIEEFEDDPDIDFAEGRFFRFATYDYSGFHLAYRRDDETNEWQVVLCDYGLLYSEMIGPQGRECVVAPSFYQWLRHLIETNGYPDECAPRQIGLGSLTEIEEASSDAQAGEAK